MLRGRSLHPLQIVWQVVGDRNAEKASDGEVHESKLMPNGNDVGFETGAADHLQLMASFEFLDAAR